MLSPEEGNAVSDVIEKKSIKILPAPIEGLKASSKIRKPLLKSKEGGLPADKMENSGGEGRKRKGTKRKYVSVKLNKFRGPFSGNGEGGNLSGRQALNLSGVRRNNKLLARALNQSRIQIQNLEKSMRDLRNENLELRVEVSDLRTLIDEAGGGPRRYTERDFQNLLKEYLEPVKGILHQALDHTLGLSGNLTQAIKLVNVTETLRRSTSSAARSFPRRKSSDKLTPSNKSLKSNVKKVSPMVSGHIVYRPDIKLKKMDVQSLLASAGSEGLRLSFPSQDEPPAPSPSRTPPSEVQVEEEGNEELREEEEETGGERAEGSEVNGDEESSSENQNVATIQQYQPRVNLRSFDLSLIGELEETSDDNRPEDDELTLRRRTSRNKRSVARNTLGSQRVNSCPRSPIVLLEDSLRSTNIDSRINRESNGLNNKNTNGEATAEGRVILLPHLVLDKIRVSPPLTKSPKEKSHIQTCERRGTYIVKNNSLPTTEDTDDTPRTIKESSDALFLKLSEDDPQEGPSWLFEDLYRGDNAPKESKRKSARQQGSSCSRKLTFINKASSVDSGLYDEGSSSSDDVFFDDNTKRNTTSLPHGEGSSRSDLKRSQKAACLDPVPKRSKTSDSPAQSTSSARSDERPRRAAAKAAANGLKEPSLCKKMRNEESIRNDAKKKSTGKKKSK